MIKETAGTKKGRILESRRGFFTVDDGEKRIVCKACTRLRIENKKPLCGDWALFTENKDGTGFITDLTPRKSVFPRPGVANADMLVLVISADTPPPDLFYTDKMTVVGILAGAKVVVAVNKTDLRDGEEFADIYRRCGFDAFAVSALKESGTAAFKDFLAGRLCVFAGPSGVGKSSLINALYPAFRAKTGMLSAKALRGKNTTRHIRLFATSRGGYIADTPGFTSIDIGRAEIPDPARLKDTFPEMAKHELGCEFRDCAHIKEKGCAVVAAVRAGEIPASRHESYVKLFENLKSQRLY